MDVRPLTRERWRDLEGLFGKNGASGGCWCMWWRMTHSEFNQQKGEGNRLALKGLVEAGETPGLLAYVDGKAVGWCALAPRETYPRLERSRILKRVDEKPVWSVVCFYVAKGSRHQGVTSRLLEAAKEYARAHGGKLLEGYPVEPKGGKSPDAFVYTGLASGFRKAGFIEIERRSETRPIMRFGL